MISEISSLFKIILYIFAGIFAYVFLNKIVRKFIRGIVEKRYKKAAKIRIETKEKTLSGIILGTAKIILIIVILLTSLSELGVDITPLLASAGVAGLAVSFASRGLIEDYIAGFFMLIDGQVQADDIVLIGPPINMEGKVADLDLRKITLENAEGDIIVVRNSKISFIVNKTHTKSGEQNIKDKK